MNALLLALVWTVYGALFEVQPIPLPTPNSRGFLAPIKVGAPPHLFVLDGTALTIYPATAPGTPLGIRLLDGTTAFDVADVDGDQHNDIVAVCGDRIVKHALTDTGAAPPLQDLFTLHTQLAAPNAQPYPYVLVIQREGRALLALPCENTLDLRTFNGELVSSYPIGENTQHRVSYGLPFTARSEYPPYIGRKDSLQLLVNINIAFVPELPPDLAHLAKEPPPRWAGDSLNPRDERTLIPGDWPWIPLKTDGTRSQRVLYALASRANETLIRLRQYKAESRDLLDQNAETGPARRYPGAIIVIENDLPDFNHDGYTDLLLWKAPEPGMSVDSLTRALTGGVWPVDLTVHLFSPKKNRYEPPPASRISCAVPVSWFLPVPSEIPVRLLALHDFNGDGRTDLACCTAPNQFCAWLYGDNGFSETPDFTYTATEPFTGTEFRADLEGTGRTSIGLRTDKAVYVLHASETPRSRN